MELTEKFEKDYALAGYIFIIWKYFQIKNDYSSQPS